jgi:hypothetical protein
VINFNINNTNSDKKLDLDTKHLKIRKDRFDKIMSPVNGNIIEFNDKDCGGKIIISFEYKDRKYIMEMCEVLYNNYKSSNTKVSSGEKIGSSTGSPLVITVKDSQNILINLSLFSEQKFKNNVNDMGNVEGGLGLFDYTVKSVYDMFKPKDNKEKISEDLKRIKKLL